jgi:hypothetical protein
MQSEKHVSTDVLICQGLQVCFPENVVYKTRQLQGQDGLLEQAEHEHDKERKTRKRGATPVSRILMMTSAGRT